MKIKIVKDQISTDELKEIGQEFYIPNLKNKMKERNSLFLMANLGSEVQKIISAKNRNDAILLKTYLTQAEKILKEIMAMPDMKSREAEIKILSDVIEDISEAKPKFNISAVNINSYFTPFVMRLMSV